MIRNIFLNAARYKMAENIKILKQICTGEIVHKSFACEAAFMRVAFNDLIISIILTIFGKDGKE